MNFEAFKNKYQKAEVEHFFHQVPSKPTVSVLVQAYNHEAFIKQCLESILEQNTDFDYEILLGEDFSSDQTREICKEFAMKYPEKIRLFLHHPANKIKVLNITTGNFNALYNLFSAKGNFIAFCEGDDYWTDSLKLQKQIDLLKEDAALSLSFHSYIQVDENDQPLTKEMALEQSCENINPLNLKRLLFHPLLSTTCFHNYFKDEIPEEMAEIVNVDSFLLSFLGNYGAAGFSGTTNPSYYRRHDGGIWSKKTKKLKFDSKILTYQKLRNFYLRQENQELAQFFGLSILNTYKMQIWRSFKEGDITKGMIFLFKVIKEYKTKF